MNTELSPLPELQPLPSPVLVTGAGGFIGSHLVEALVEQGCHVRALVRYNSQGTWGWLEHSPAASEVKIIQGDIRDFDSVFRAMEDCATVFHLAALVGIPYSYVSPLAYLKTNMEGTYNVLEAARLLGVHRLVVTSTSETYGAAHKLPIDESHPVLAQSPYAASKIGADQLALSYHLSFGLPLTIVRPFNTYGPRQSARAFIPSVIVQLLSGQSSIHLGNLKPSRDLTFVEDTVSAFLALAGCDEVIGEVTNVGTNREISMGDLARRLARAVGVNAEILEDVERIRPEASEVQRLRCENRRLIEATGWRAQVELDTGLGITIDWIKENLEHYKPSIYSV